MRQKRVSNFYAATLSIIGAALILGSNDRVILALQDFFKVPGRQFQIGAATFVKPSDWVLLSYRDTKDGAVKLFGGVPEWLTASRLKPPRGRYLSFRVLSSHNLSTVTFLETEPQLVKKIEDLLPYIRKLNLANPLCSWERRRYVNFEGLECKSAESLVVYLPDVQTTIVVFPFEAGIVDLLRIASVADFRWEKAI